MKKNHVFYRVLGLLLVLVLLLPTVLTACTGNSGGKGDETTNETTDNPEDSTPTSGEQDTKPAEGTVAYEITAKSQGGMALSAVTVTLTSAAGEKVATGTTDENGTYTVWLDPAVYTVTLSDMKKGYTAESVQTAQTGGATVVIATTAVITSEYPNQPSAYTKGDVMYDFAFVDDEVTTKLSQILETKKLVVINFWGTYCSPCKAEFPAIEAAWQEYSDQVEVIALSISDTSKKCEEFRENNGYTFHMLPDIGLYSRFTGMAGGAYVPISVFVDRYGVIADFMVGGDPSADAWKAEMAFYVSDEYSQTGNSGYVDNDTPTVEKPDVTMPDSAEIEKAINGAGFSGTYTATDPETIWPWVLTDDKTAIQPSNYGKHSTSAMISTEVTLQKGQLIAFDYRYSIEYDIYERQIYDMLAVYVDGHIMQKMITKQDGWVTCYAYTPVEAGTHTVTLVYTKDSSDSYGYMETGNEYVHVKNMRTMTVEEMTAQGGSMNVLRHAATEPADAGATTSYKNYATVVYNSKDGYYHVGTEDGPLLLAKLCGSTQWSNSSLEDLASVGYLKINGIDYADKINRDLTRSYCWLEKYSTLGYSVVDKTLASLLDLFASELGEGANHEWEWLEFCSYFDHYGVGDGIVEVFDVRQGIDEKSAFDATFGKNHAEVNQVLVPRGFFFKFVPEKTGVYAVYSLAEGTVCSNTAGSTTIAWLLDENGTEMDISDNERGDGQFYIYHTMEAGKTYYITVGFDPVDDLGSFDFMIDYVGETMDVMTVCTAGWTTTEDVTHIIIWRNYDFEAALDADGYYRQVLGYEKDGTPILDMSDHGYVYVDFLGVSQAEGAGYIPWIGDWATLQKCIEEGYYTDDMVLHKDAFDFTKRTDSEGNSLAAFGNHQAEMEKYLAMAKAGDLNADDYGYVKANQELAEILDNLMVLYGMLDVDGTRVQDQWLMFCCFFRHA